VDYGPFAVRALAEEPDGFIFTSHPEGIAKIIIELQDRGWDDNNAILLSQAAPVPALWEIGEGHLEGTHCWMWFNPNSDSPKWQNINAEHKRAFGQPATFMMVWKGYDELYMIKSAFEALQITGDPAKLAEERIAIRDYLNDLKDFDSVFGPVDFTDGIRANPILLFTVENNELGPVEELEPLL
jgi:ABC-type branched-subunit amino acid transport system substrate-binding protein